MQLIELSRPEELEQFFYSLSQKRSYSKSSIEQARNFLQKMKPEGYYLIENETIAALVVFSKEKSTVLGCFVLPEFENQGLERKLIRKAVEDLRENGAQRIAGAFLVDHPSVQVPIMEELGLLGFSFAEEVEMANNSLEVPSLQLPEGFSLVPYRDVNRREMIRVKYLGNKGETENPLVRGVTTIEETEREVEKTFSGMYGPFLYDASLMLFHGNDAVGCISCIQRPDGIGVITNVTVLPAFRNKSLGKILVAESLKAMKKRGISRVQLSVVTSNIAAVRIYEGLGFKEIARVCYYLWKTQDFS